MRKTTYSNVPANRKITFTRPHAVLIAQGLKTATRRYTIQTKPYKEGQLLYVTVNGFIAQTDGNGLVYIPSAWHEDAPQANYYPLVIHVLGTRWQRLKDMTKDDLAAEGYTGFNAESHFASAWDSINNRVKRFGITINLSWDTNPKVFVVDFEMWKQPLLL